LKQAADQSWLVVSTPLKNMKVNGKDDIPYMKWKIKAMFETTNQKVMAWTLTPSIQTTRWFVQKQHRGVSHLATDKNPNGFSRHILG